MGRDITRPSRRSTATAAEKAQAREVSLRRIARLFAPHRWSVAAVTALIIVSSMTARSRKGEAIATTDDTMINAVTTATDHRCGANRRAIRRSETSRACAFSTAVAVDRRDGRGVSLSKEHSCLSNY